MPISIRDRLGMWFRKVSASEVSRALSTIEGAGGTIRVKELEAQYLAGGNISACAEAMRITLDFGIGADWGVIAVADLAGLDVVAIAQEAVRDRRALSDVFSDRLASK